MTFIESETTGLKSSVVADLLLYNTKTRKTISVDADLSDKWGAVLLFY